MKNFSDTFVTEINYWASDTAIEMWIKWNPDEIDKDLKELSVIGAQVIRIFPLCSEYQPILQNTEPLESDYEHNYK